MTSAPDDTTMATSWGPLRSRTVEWHDPALSTATGITMPGIDYLRAMMEGKLPSPPIAELMHITASGISTGRVVFRCAPDESMYNATGAIHGGVVCTVLDMVAGCALLTTLPAGKGMVSVEIKVNYLRAVHPSMGPLTATGSVVRRGSRLGFTEGAITDANDTIVATASSTLLIFDA